MCRFTQMKYRCGHKDSVRFYQCGKFFSRTQCEKLRAEGLQRNHRNDRLCDDCYEAIKKADREKDAKEKKEREEMEKTKTVEEEAKKNREEAKARRPKKGGKGVGKRNAPIPAGRGLPKTSTEKTETGKRAGKRLHAKVAKGGLTVPRRPGEKRLPKTQGLHVITPAPGREGMCIKTTKQNKLCNNYAMGLSRYCHVHRHSDPNYESS